MVFKKLLSTILCSTCSLCASNNNEENLMKNGSILPNEELKPFSTIAKSFAGGEIFEHYKGKRYRVLSVGRNSETLEECIVYQALYGDHDVWIRPLSMFLENIVFNGIEQPRFKRIQ